MVTLRPVDSRICLVDSETALGPKLPWLLLRCNPNLPLHSETSTPLELDRYMVPQKNWEIHARFFRTFFSQKVPCGTISKLAALQWDLPCRLHCTGSWHPKKNWNLSLFFLSVFSAKVPCWIQSKLAASQWNIQASWTGQVHGTTKKKRGNSCVIFLAIFFTEGTMWNHF